jgi:hypothetical protein
MPRKPISRGLSQRPPPLDQAQRSLPRTPLLVFGDPHGHEGDSRFWTLRFDRPVTSGREALASEISSRLGKVADVSVIWTSSERLEIDVGLERFTASRWEKLLARVEETIDAIHARHPLFAVIFAGADDLHEAPRHVVEAYAAMGKARGAERLEAVRTALGSTISGLEDMALKHVIELLGTDDLRRFMDRSEADEARVRTALATALRSEAFDYGTDPKSFDEALRKLELRTVSKEVSNALVMAAVRDAPAMGRALAALAERDASVYDALLSSVAERDGAAESITLAFAETERGSYGAARAHLQRARELYPTPKTELWKVTIPRWLEELDARLRAVEPTS